MKKECIKLDTLFKQGKRLQTKWVEMKWDKHGNLAAEREETILIKLTGGPTVKLRCKRECNKGNVYCGVLTSAAWCLLQTRYRMGTCEFPFYK